RRARLSVSEPLGILSTHLPPLHRPRCETYPSLIQLPYTSRRIRPLLFQRNGKPTPSIHLPRCFYMPVPRDIPICRPGRLACIHSLPSPSLLSSGVHNAPPST